ncbi:MAG TPA: error-prone DNA polymerase [Chryseosolibacter sp.]|nr:error-prone DNA polymerase [Chryseosolibacter sp.]
MVELRYTELQVTTNFTFLRGASHPEEMVEQAARFNYEKIAITDRNTFAGIVRAHSAAKKTGIKIIPGCRLDLIDGSSLIALPTDRNAYSRLSNLLTKGNLRAEKGKCHLYKADVYDHATGTKFILIPPSVLNSHYDFEESFKKDAAQYREAFGSNLWIGAHRLYNGYDGKYVSRIFQLSKALGIPMVATNDVHYHDHARRELQDVMTCVREKCTIHNAGFRLHANAERYLKTDEEMLRLFRNYPDAIRQTQIIAEACEFSLDQLKYQYPKEIITPGRTAQDDLTDLTWKGARDRFGNEIPEHIQKTIRYELDFISQMNYAEYFLTVYDIVRFAREKEILCQGRGSAANSTVCYCLGITSVDPSKFELLFERFISSARNEPPDIDVDFEHERREEVMQYIYNKYGRDRAAVVATVTQQHHKGAIRDVGKAMGLSVDTISRLSGLIWDFEDEGFDKERIISQGINPDEPLIRKVLELTKAFMGFPRQLGQHTGGFVITNEKLSDLCPILNARMADRTNIEWNKDDIDALGFMKIDVLALGMLTCIRKAFDLVNKHYDRKLTLANIPQDDKKVYEMVSHADTIGVFQIESRAQQSMLPRLRPKCFYDLVIEVAIVRPGPIQGDMVHPYLRRRNGLEKIEYPSPELENILKRTLGVPLFQEQAMKIAIVAAGFSPTEADLLRRSMATFKAKGLISHFEEKLIKGMTSKGYSEEYAKKVFRQLEGFGSYGFPESHAVSFALLVYVSSWIKCHYPDVFACALLNSMPMGFYQPAQIIIDARKHGVEVRQVDVNHSAWDNTLEEVCGQYRALRLGFRQIKGFRQDDADMLVRKRKQFYRSVAEVRATGIGESALEMLAAADGFGSLGHDRREALWNASVKGTPPAMFASDENEMTLQEKATLPKMTLGEHVLHDYASTSLSLKSHPVALIRQQLEQLRVLSTQELFDVKNKAQVKVAGLILVRQRPGTAKGVCFITLEDETGTANLVVFQNLFDKYRKEIIQSRLLMVEGALQREGEVIHVIVSKCYNYSRLLNRLADADDPGFSVQRTRADETTSPGPDPRDKTEKFVQGKIFHEGRNFR